MVWKISGRVLNAFTQQGLPMIRVEVWDKDLFFNDLVGSAVTDQQGCFQISFDESYFQELFFDRQPDLFFKVFQADRLLKSTENSVLWNVRAGDTSIVIAVELPSILEDSVQAIKAAVLRALKSRRIGSSDQMNPWNSVSDISVTVGGFILGEKAILLVGETFKPPLNILVSQEMEADG